VIFVCIVVILCGSEEFVRDFMLMAHKMDMTNGEYVYIVVDQLPSKHVFTPWVAGDDQDETARLAFESVLQVHATLFYTVIVTVLLLNVKILDA